MEAALHLIVYAMDIDNAFQCTHKEDSIESPPAYFTMPHLYLAWFRHRFTKIEIEEPAPYFLKMINFMQGNKEEGREFHELQKPS